ncbi:hypothetical protein [Mycolicibacterium obuense]|uniref:Uncharacterized protein n=1 Tax=Mycolicibacterium obuense TaxID=1807 RepID=A0A0J6VZN6_9MYCO|nr:hypothetical protein [Mycolicibacterium obuense]KMO75584.1 hypothetical protein MOBUDSM44075_02953 [Mycolicibacterium obuense]
MSPRYGRAPALSVVALLTVAVAAAPPAAADVTDALRSAVVASRGMKCPPLHFNPVVDQAAEAINATTDAWLNHASRAVPETDALPVLHDLGHGGTKAAILSGAAGTAANSIKALLLQGFAKISDCSYVDVGVSALYNAKKDMILTTVVLAA